MQFYWILFEFLTADLFEYFVYCPSMFSPNQTQNWIRVPSYPPSSSEVTLPLWAGDPDPSPGSQFPPPVAQVPTSSFSLCLNFLHPLQFLFMSAILNLLQFVSTVFNSSTMTFKFNDLQAHYLPNMTSSNIKSFENHPDI